MTVFDHDWHHDGRVTRFSWLGHVDADVGRVYAFAFTDEGLLLLVSDTADDSQPVFWLPGGGVEEGETAEEALARELHEEAGATIHALEPLGVQLCADEVWGVHHQGFYWCRISLDASFVPAHEVSQHRLVPPTDFLDTLFWGRDDPKGAMLLERAIEINASR